MMLITLSSIHPSVLCKLVKNYTGALYLLDRMDVYVVWCTLLITIRWSLQDLTANSMNIQFLYLLLSVTDNKCAPKMGHSFTALVLIEVYH